MEVPAEVLQGRHEIGAAVKETIAQQIMNHTVIVTRTPEGEAEPLDDGMKYMVGSGTLVQVDVGDAQPRYGLLTCGHVLGAFDQAMRGTCNDSMVLLVMNNKAKGASRRGQLKLDTGTKPQSSRVHAIGEVQGRTWRGCI